MRRGDGSIMKSEVALAKAAVGCSAMVLYSTAHLNLGVFARWSLKERSIPTYANMLQKWFLEIFQIDSDSEKTLLVDTRSII